MDPHTVVGCLRVFTWYSYVLIAFLCAWSLDLWAGDRGAATAQSLSAFSIHGGLRYHDGGVVAVFEGMSCQCAYDLQRKPACFLRFLFDLPGLSQSSMHHSDPYFENDFHWMCVVRAWWLRSVERPKSSGSTFAAELYFLQHLRSCAACSSGSQCSGLSSPTGSLTLLARFCRRLRRGRELLQEAVSAMSAVLCNMGSELGSGMQACCRAAVAYLITSRLYCRVLGRWVTFFVELWGRLCNSARPMVGLLQYVFFLYMGATSSHFFPWILALVSLQLMWCQVPWSDLSQLAGLGWF